MTGPGLWSPREKRFYETLSPLRRVGLCGLMGIACPLTVAEALVYGRQVSTKLSSWELLGVSREPQPAHSSHSVFLQGRSVTTDVRPGPNQGASQSIKRALPPTVLLKPP